MQRGNFQKNLDFVDGVAMRRHTHTKAVPGKRGIALIYGVVDIAEVVDLEWIVPVGTVKTNSVSEDLDGVARAAVRLTVRSRKLVLARHNFAL